MTDLNMYPKTILTSVNRRSWKRKVGTSVQFIDHNYIIVWFFAYENGRLNIIEITTELVVHMIKLSGLVRGRARTKATKFWTFGPKYYYNRTNIWAKMTSVVRISRQNPEYRFRNSRALISSSFEQFWSNRPFQC